MGTSHTSETAVRGVHDGIKLELRDIALPGQSQELYSNLTHLQMDATDHNDTRSKRVDL